jgi:hypothetical protein
MMPTVKQKYAAPVHVPIPYEYGGLDVCGENEDQWDHNIARADCADCLQFLMQLGRWAETRYYALP